MNVILLDTNIVSFALKGDSRVNEYAPYLQGKRLAISFMTVAELYQWAFVRKWGPRRVKQLEQTLMTTYTVLAFDGVLCQKWGEIRAIRRTMGRPISSQDAWVAATALQYGLPLITHSLEIITTAT